MQRIDSHQHFWKFDPVRDAWINESMAVIQRDFLPADLLSLLSDNRIEGCVAVQADQSEAENKFLLDLANQHDYIRGVVGWIDLQSGNIQEQLSHYSHHKKLKGFRHILQGEKQRDFMLRPAFKHGIAALHAFGFTYDILIFPDQLEYSKIFIKDFPYQPFVIDHISKPYIKDKKIEDWKREITALAKFSNVSCKVSGMVTEADWKNWKKEDFKPYLDVVVEAFGMKRLMFGSDWPVCLVAGSYSEVVNLVSEYFSGFSEDEQNDFFGRNASRFYNL
jgi:L-fuconolactonase